RADQANAGVFLGQRVEMLPGAKADFQPDFLDARKIVAWIGARLKREGELGKEGPAQFHLASGLFGTFAPAIQFPPPGGGRLFGLSQTAPLIASARSVFSQEKPPSASGSRPKWP